MSQFCYSLKDVLEFAMDKEEKARDFYESCQNRAQNSGLKKFFQEMAQEEQNHRDKLSNIDLEKEKQDIQIESPESLSAGDFMVDVHFRPDLTYQEALIMSIKKEEKAHSFYQAWKNRCSDPETSEIFNWLAREEHKHKQKVEDMYEDDIMGWQ